MRWKRETWKNNSWLCFIAIFLLNENIQIVGMFHKTADFVRNRRFLWRKSCRLFFLMLIRCLFLSLLRVADVYPAAGRSALLPSLWGGRFFRPCIEPAQLSDTGPLVVVQGMAVLVHRDGRIGVAQQPGERHHVHPLLQ